MRPHTHLIEISWPTGGLDFFYTRPGQSHTFFCNCELSVFYLLLTLQEEHSVQTVT